MFDLLIKNAKVVSSGKIVEADVGVLNGKIEKIGSLSEKAKKEIDGTGKFLLPGAIDMHVHFRDPGFPGKGNFSSESRAAAAGGVTTIFDMPNTNPPTLNLAALEEKRLIAAKKSLVNYGFYLGLSNNNLEEIEKAKNIAGVKIYMGSSTGNLLMQDENIIKKVFEIGTLVVVHAEDENIIRENEKKFSDKNEPRIHSLIRSPEAAYEAVKSILHLAKKHEAKVHITHVTTQQELEEIEKFHASCDVTPHHLAFTDDYYTKLGNYGKVNPPLRSENDRQALWSGLKKGIISIVASDHAPHTKAEKEQDYWKAPAGVPGVQTLLPYLLDAAEHGDLTLSDVVALTSENPAKLFGLLEKGKIEVGYDADLVLVDMGFEHEVTDKILFYKCGWSPFLGWKFRGWPVLTVVNGNIIYENGEIVSDAKGKEVQFSHGG